jgi:hypothetical protein
MVHFSSGKKRYSMDLYSFLYYSKALTGNPYLSENDKIKIYPKISYDEDSNELYCDNQKPNAEFDLALELIKTVPQNHFKFVWEAFKPFMMTLANNRSKLFRCMDTRTTVLLAAAGLSAVQMKLFHEEINFLWSELKPERQTHNPYRHFKCLKPTNTDIVSSHNFLENHLKRAR